MSKTEATHDSVGTDAIITEDYPEAERVRADCPACDRSWWADIRSTETPERAREDVRSRIEKHIESKAAKE
jgi:hypothetical protein